MWNDQTISQKRELEFEKWKKKSIYSLQADKASGFPHASPGISLFVY